MSGLDHWLSSLGSIAGTPVLVWAAGALAALLAVGAVVAFRHTRFDLTRMGWRGALLVAGVGLALVWFQNSAAREQAAARRALDARAADLTARAIAPGSALACLDSVANATVEMACEKALFASPEAVAAALSYMDARLALLADGVDLAARDPRYEPALERLRRSIEADRFGIAAHVLLSRGCTANDCPAFKLLRDNSRVVANFNQRTFDANVVLHAATWHAGAPAMASAPVPVPQPAAAAAVSTGVPVASKYDFPSAASIPAVSIMDAEPPRPPEPAAEAKAGGANVGQAPPASARTATPPRRQSAREPVAATPPPPPMPLTPSAAPPPADAWQGAR